MARAWLAFVIAAVLPLASPAGDEGSLLIRVERVSADDLKIFHSAGPWGLDDLRSRGALLHSEEGWGLLRLHPETMGEELAADGYLWSPLLTISLELTDDGHPPLPKSPGEPRQPDGFDQSMVDG